MPVEQPNLRHITQYVNWTHNPSPCPAPPGPSGRWVPSCGHPPARSPCPGHGSSARTCGRCASKGPGACFPSLQQEEASAPTHPAPSTLANRSSGEGMVGSKRYLNNNGQIYTVFKPFHRMAMRKRPKAPPTDREFPQGYRIKMRTMSVWYFMV
ncbi:hypothetical protein PoB_003260800 [Plakobranchus ocellatus]|uniref:Uncharacterized protein n=1 Tax=Plakobranchus ocellatus TaxID=259542 RepID=A0AAV4AHU2_9GAST|nr:hypothetical protein PoB_003260800 [Plakobranchus ocellatus]